MMETGTTTSSVVAKWILGPGLIMFYSGGNIEVGTKSHAGVRLLCIGICMIKYSVLLADCFLPN